MARVDTLPESAKEILQTGSVIEREFNYQLIKHVTNTSEKELLSCLSVLKDSELLYERGIFPDSTYIFKRGRALVDLAPNWWGPRFDFLEGMLLGNEVSPDFKRIKACLNQSIQGDENVGAVVPAAQTRYHIAKFLAREGATEDSHKMFKELSNQFKSWGIPIWQKKCRQKLEFYRS